MKVACFTSFSFSYLNRARVLANSVKRFHPDWTFIALITDEAPEEFSFEPKNEPFDEVKFAEDLEIDDARAWIFRHNVIEVCTAVKGPFLLELLERGFDRVFYLDPDTAVFSSFDTLLDALDTHDVILTPHQLAPEKTEMGVRDNEIGSLKYGIYNLGFAGVANRGDGPRFAQWWRDRCVDWCWDDIPNGLFVDQRWCDHAPGMFAGVGIIRDPGCNVASWNLSNRTVEIGLDGRILVNGSELKFYHFTKLGALGDTMTERYADGNVEVYEIWSWYKRQVERATDAAIPKGWWAYGRYSNGEPIKQHARNLYRLRKDLREAFPDPFDAEGKECYFRWLGAEGHL